MWAAEAAFARSGSWREEEDEQEALRWAALQRLPTVARARRGLLRSPAPGEDRVQGDDALCEVDVAGLSPGDRTALVDRLLADSGDVEDFFRRIRSRFDASVPHCSLSLSPPASLLAWKLLEAQHSTLTCGAQLVRTHTGGSF